MRLQRWNRGNLLDIFEVCLTGRRQKPRPTIDEHPPPSFYAPLILPRSVGHVVVIMPQFKGRTSVVGSWMSTHSRSSDDIYENGSYDTSAIRSPTHLELLHFLTFVTSLLPFLFV